MKVKDIIAVASEYDKMALVDQNGDTVDRYDGRNAISPAWNEYEVMGLYVGAGMLIVEIEVEE